MFTTIFDLRLLESRGARVFSAMNRSFRAHESQMQAAMRQRQQQLGGIRVSVMKEKEEELALFLEMKKREKERNDLLLNGSEEFDAPLGNDFFEICSIFPF